MKARIHHARSRPLPEPIDPGMPAHLKAIAMTAMVGTLDAPIGSPIEKVYLCAAKAIIDAALAMHRNRHAADFMKAAGR